MLELKLISKQYRTGELVQQALDGVSLSLRDSEFVSILGPSGSGKTTLLNIIGGLDRYDSGDLIINGRSTTEYTERDWDAYRNHTIGFVFQSYNLIPHQSVLANVELALTIGGVSRSERRKRAKQALAEVGLAGQEHKKPNQMSGGQMQRVAIARALVNDPDILLADEPTGALDTETSVQIMELLKRVAEKRLVVMVTHNPELAEQYSSRIVKLRDGRIVDDSDPFTPEEAAPVVSEGAGKARMSFGTSLALSAQNLRTKKGRTILTAFAGSIGIIGIALILSLSTGVNRYIEEIQKDTMSSYPVTISAETLDLSGILQQRGAMMGGRLGRAEQEETVEDRVGVDYSALESAEAITSSVTENDLTAFKRYVDDPDSEIRPYIGENGVVYTYDVRFEVYAYDGDGNLLNTNADIEESSSGQSATGFGGMMRGGMGGMGAMGSMLGSTGSSDAENFSELMRGSGGAAVSQVVTDSYELLSGAWPEKENEVVLVLDENNALPAETLYQLGILTAEEYQEMADAIAEGEKGPELSWSYEELMDRSFYLIPACDRYRENEDGTFSYIGDGVTEQEELLENAMELRVSGVIRPLEDAANATISTALAYPSSLTDTVIERTNESAVVLAQEESPEVNVLTGMAFEAPDDGQKIEDAKAYIAGLGVSDKATLYQMIQYIQSSAAEDAEDEADTEKIETEETPEPGFQMPEGQPEGGEGPQQGSAPGQGAPMTMDESALAGLLDRWVEETPDEEILLSLYDEYVAGASYEDNMTAFGKVSYDAPSSISIYTDSFEDKDAIAACIEHYNETVDSKTQITYTDYVALLTSSITSIVDVISYVLIAFVAVSLIVSCIMIGIITHISVLERTKEIGILRALGASKRNVSQVFNAETVLIGLCSGVLGVAVSALLTVPINALLQGLLGASTLRAALPVTSAAVLILLSVVITVIGGLIPARKAAKKDPVVALRTE